MADWTSDTIPKNIMETLVVDDLAVNYEISAGTIQAKNAATAWVNFDGTTTPPTIRDSFNVSDVVRTATGRYDVYFKTPMDDINYSGVGSAYSDRIVWVASNSISHIDIGVTTNASAYSDSLFTTLQIFGGK